VYDRALIVPIDPRKFYILWRASVICVDGVRLGTDKIGHFIHHGYNYYVAYRAAQRAGCDDAECRRRAAAIATGGHLFFSERMLLGTLTSGVVSNADLAANYLGLLFYLNLTQAVRVRGVPRPALLKLEDGQWRLAPHVRPDGDFFTVFMCDHMDEALNPNLYDGLTAAVLRQVVTPWCSELRRQYTDANGEPRPPGWFRRRAEELRTYYGEDYGYCGPADTLIGIAPVCDCGGVPRSPLRDPKDAPAGDAVARLHAACTAGDAPAVEALLAAGAAVNAPLAAEDAAWGCAGDTALHAAVRGGQAALAARLLRAGADPSARTLRAATPLHLAAADEGCAAALLDAGTDPNARDALGRTPLHRAVRAGQPGVVRQLLAAGARPAAADCDGQTPLHEAVRAGSPELVALLLAHHAAPAAAALYGETPLHLAAQTGRTDLAGQLLDGGAGPSAADEFGRTPLHRAVAAGHGQAAALLLARGADVRAADVNGTTGLHLAARAGDAALVELLLKHGADRSARSAQGRTPLAEARAAGHAAVAARLEGPRGAGQSARLRGGRP
jgi:ankyrin repeat protein